jgi:hypothetical protein
VDASGGLQMQDNTITLGPVAPVRAAAIWTQGTADITLRRNHMTNSTGQPMALLLNWSSGNVALEGNLIGAGDSETSTSGYLRARAAGMAHQAIDMARGGASQAIGGAKQIVKGLLGR